jgi:FixJ family two-component response regulator
MNPVPHCIAVVDDDPGVLRGLARLLRARSFTTKTYQSGELFLASLPDGLPDCLVVDLQMPEMTGLELQQNLRNNGVRIPTIIISAYDEVGMRDRCKAAGAIAFLLKPLQDTTLFSAVNSALKQAN